VPDRSCLPVAPIFQRLLDLEGVLVVTAWTLILKITKANRKVIESMLLLSVINHQAHLLDSPGVILSLERRKTQPIIKGVEIIKGQSEKWFLIVSNI